MKLGTRNPRTPGKSCLVHTQLETYMAPTKFALSFTAGGLLYHESIVVAESFVAAGCDWSVALAEIEKRNNSSNEKITDWIKWAKDRLSELDPISNGLDTFLKKYEYSDD